jgi:hypothetical protein
MRSYKVKEGLAYRTLSNCSRLIVSYDRHRVYKRELEWSEDNWTLVRNSRDAHSNPSLIRLKTTQSKLIRTLLDTKS